MRKEYHINHYGYWHKRIGISYYSNRRRIGIYTRFKDWWGCNSSGFLIGIEFLWFGIEFFMFPAVGIYHDGRDIRTIGFGGRIINKSYLNT